MASSHPVSKDRILSALAEVEDSEEGADVVSLGYVSGLVIKDGHVGFALDVGDAEKARSKEPLRQAAENAVRGLPGVLSATVVLTAERPPETAKGRTRGSALKQAPTGQALKGIERVSAIIAVASGKGGVGKSTVAVNLAVALSRQGKSVGLLDADIYGPSVPRLVGAKAKPESSGKMLEPLSAHGLKTMSIGYLVEEEKAMIWRGPMVVSAITQLLADVNWGALDVLVVDMPPGTGDAQLTMAQRVPLAGAVIVSTPQDIALLDARKGIAMFAQVNVPVLGLVENMSYFACPHCGERSDIFGHGGARKTADKLGADFLGEIPLHISIRETSDAGTPVVSAAPERPEAQAFQAVARAVSAALADPKRTKAAPSIVVE